MHIAFLTRKSALIYRRGLRQRVASLTLDCNGVFAIRAYRRGLRQRVASLTLNCNGDFAIRAYVDSSELRNSCERELECNFFNAAKLAH